MTIQEPHIRRGEIERQLRRLNLENGKMMTAAQGIERALSNLKSNVADLYEVIERLECSCGFPVPSKKDIHRLVSIEILRQLQERATLFALSPTDVDAAIAGKAPPLPGVIHTLIIDLNSDFQKSIAAEQDAIRKAITGELTHSPIN